MNEVKRMMVVKTEIPNLYSMIVEFRSQDSRSEFIREFDQKNIQIFDNERFVMKIFKGFSIERDEITQVFEPEQIFSLSQKDSEQKKAPLQCPVCLLSEQDIKKDKEKTSATFIQILCGHSFDYDCIMNWKQDICAICRYPQTP